MALLRRNFADQRPDAAINCQAGRTPYRESTMTDVTNRTAFITGGANGIGLGIAARWPAGRVKLALADTDEAALGRAKSELSAITACSRDRSPWMFARIAKLSRVQRLPSRRSAGSVSLLFNNVAVSAGELSTAKLTYELWDWGLGINLTGVVNGVQTFLPRMIAQKNGGHIVNTASGAGQFAVADRVSPVHHGEVRGGWNVGISGA